MYYTVYKNLEAELVRKGISREQLAKTIGRSYNTTTLKLNGKYQFTLKECKLIKNILFPELSVEYLFAED